MAAPGEAGPSRRVRTVPPSAAWEPPSPPSLSPQPTGTSPTRPSNDSTLVNSTIPKRPRMKLRYSTSDSSDDEGDDSDDDEPPWWTFTQKGMMRMRAKSLRRANGVGDKGKAKATVTEDSDANGSAQHDNTKESGSDRGHRPMHRSSSGQSTPSAHWNLRPAESPTKPRAPLGPPIRINPKLLARRTMKRRYSAPGSPIAEDNPQHPPIGLIPKTSSTPPVRSSLHESSLPSQALESYTDTEAVRPKRLKQRAHTALVPSSLPNPLPHLDPGSGASTPRYRRMASTRLMKLNLPPPLTQHFSHGWPHAGSWQDALHGHYGNSPRAHDSRVRKGSDTHRRSKDATTSAHSPTTPPKRAKSRRRRYIQALAPPTPSGLGFTPTERENRHRQTRMDSSRSQKWKEGKVVEEGFDWGLGQAERGNAAPKPEAADSATQSQLQTRQGSVPDAEALVDEKGKRVKRSEGLSRRQRWRRMLFLDARVTIYLRFLNLVIVVILLALAITTRLELFRLRLPGLLGPSTTLMISYSVLTIVHVLIAVYREYFGRPIGLWGLRSKMLWVCLDLVLICLWSSALSLAINDLIATPLDCVPTDPWWRSGLATSYAKLLNELSSFSTLNLDSIPDSGHTPVSLIAATLGIELPDEIVDSPLAREVCRRQAGCIALVILALLLYGGNMVLSLFRIFETVRRTSNVDRAVMI